LLRYFFCDRCTGQRIFKKIVNIEIVSFDRFDNERTVHCHVTRDIRPGMYYYCYHTLHSRPAILIERAENVRLTDVTIHSQPGMGIVGNRSENVTLTRLRIVPSAGHHCSTNTDATHFTSIKGLLRYEDCEFEGQGDDAVNVHGYYQDIVRRESAATVCIQAKPFDGTHAQSLDYPDAGDLMELTNFSSLEVRDTYRVLESTPLPDEWMCRVTLDHPLPEETGGWVLADVTRLPRLEFVGCTCIDHEANGLCIRTRSALVEGNLFRDLLGSGVKVALEPAWWESAAAADVVIRGNRIIRCGEGDWCAAVQVYANSSKPEGQYIRRVTIEDNIIDQSGHPHGIVCRNVEGLTIARNHICTDGSPVEIEYCTDVSCDV
jgi:hypothetical protein